jgi:hypothetical protein
MISGVHYMSPGVAPDDTRLLNSLLASNFNFGGDNSIYIIGGTRIRKTVRLMRWRYPYLIENLGLIPKKYKSREYIDKLWTGVDNSYNKRVQKKYTKAFGNSIANHVKPSNFLKGK